MYRKALLSIVLFFLLSACASTLPLLRERCDSFFRGKKVSVIQWEQALPRTRDYFEAELIDAGAIVFDQDHAEYRIYVGSGFTTDYVSFDARYITAWVRVRVLDRLGRVSLNSKGEVSFSVSDYNYFFYDIGRYSYDSRAERVKNSIDSAAAQARNDLICAWVAPAPLGQKSIPYFR